MIPTRRQFLKTSLAGGSMVAWGLTVPGFLARTASAAPAADRPGAKDTILVVVQLTGGNDGLNTVIPFKDDEYAKLRPTLKLGAAEVKKVNDELGLHPQMTGLAELLQDNALCIVQGVGYPNPSQSHFRSMDIWQAASMAESLNEGWIGRALRQMPASGAAAAARRRKAGTCRLQATTPAEAAAVFRKARRLCVMTRLLEDSRLPPSS